MAVRTTLRALLTTFILVSACAAQNSTPDAKKPCTSNCPPPAADTTKPSTAQKFPYPGESPKPAAPASSADPEVPQPTPPAASPNKQFPYPGEANSSSSSSSSSNPDATSPDPAAAPSPDDDSPPEPKSTRRKLPKVKQLQSPEDREAEDLYVARFYRDAGNLEGAYLRSKDAVKYQPDDPDAHLLLAEIARKLNKRDEAIAEFNAILKLDASPEQLKTARKALTQLR
jgi:hypothetical protein